MKEYFSRLNMRQEFKYSGWKCLKIAEVEDSRGLKFNAVNLDLGILWFIQNNEKVKVKK